MTGAAGQQRVQQDFAANFPVPVPPADEQDGIVRFIENETLRFRTAIAKIEREIELIREYRIRLIADVVTGKLDVRQLAPPPGSLEPDDATESDIEDECDEGAGEGVDEELAEADE
jgi:hypothetical protein